MIHGEMKKIGKTKGLMLLRVMQAIIGILIK